MFLNFLLFFVIFINFSVFADCTPNISHIKQELEFVKISNNLPYKNELILTLQMTLNFLNERQYSIERINRYHQIITDFPNLKKILYHKIINIFDVKFFNNFTNLNDLNREIIQINQQLLKENSIMERAQQKIQKINEFLSKFSKQLSEAKLFINKFNFYYNLYDQKVDFLSEAKNFANCAKYSAQKARVNELYMAQLSANNRQELIRIKFELHKKKFDKLNNHLMILYSKLNKLRVFEIKKIFHKIIKLVYHYNDKLSSFIKDYFILNKRLFVSLNNQFNKFNIIFINQNIIHDKIFRSRHILFSIKEQSKLSNFSNLFNENLRRQVVNLSKFFKLSQLDNELGEIRVQRLLYENLLNKSKQDYRNNYFFSNSCHDIFEIQFKIRKRILNYLITGCDNYIIEIIKLKILTVKLQDILEEIKESVHKYFYWTADANPVGINYFVDIYHNFIKFISVDTFIQLVSAFLLMFSNIKTLLPILISLLFIFINIINNKNYDKFLNYSSMCIGKITKDRFSLTLYVTLLSMLSALPTLCFFTSLGLGFQYAWSYPIAVALGNGIITMIPLLSVFMISAKFARSNGLFIAHFRWPISRVNGAMKYYFLTVGIMIPLMILLFTFNNLNEHFYYVTLGRLCFVLFCIILSFITYTLQRAGIFLYLNKKGTGKSLFNKIIWNIMICIPLLASLASCIGYFTTAQDLLIRVEISVFVWFLLLIIYYVIRRWMLIQRRRIAFDRDKQRRTEILLHRIKNDEDIGEISSDNLEIDESLIDLDTISAQSLRLLRSLLTLIALLSIIVIWSKIHSAFSFLERIKLWNISTSIQGIENLKSVTLESLLIATLIFIITMQLVYNLPSLLELVILQHLNLTPGTSYAITTLTKYFILFIGGIVGFFIIGIEWSKFQWLIAALGVGLGFGLQEIFANLISGLIILFEKPIRIGDTVTIRNLTGNVTCINTRATTITDWDRKEIIMPNKAFVTEQFINWSLSDSVTRIVLYITVDVISNTKLVIDILKKSALKCSYVINIPKPEAYLVDLQYGVQLFELRVHVAEMGHRMPLRSMLNYLILEEFKKNNISVPFVIFHMKSYNFDMHYS
ncbi:miniconductance mechanosensitive channel MscM [Candidatus Purcelliella pentastirinorum]|uniref:Miniconductance mechanosensitive channel MscM n=1 Tax=Candidatus Purcelliella pentastirinorum TaxID=472834 RepID=A0AAX3NAI9_9ENTR|nr:miniconductance mechanosensitive channel MscM [Candidatus Purcelliella pentastirinorum]WDI78516.1 miniconductance mechanosensitive channel MscM [Candidatus Purcelliella pentastirinorum]